MIRSRVSALILMVLFGCASNRVKTGTSTPPTPPPDQPITVYSDPELQKLAVAIQPYVEKAKSTYPQAKSRFLAGLPAGSAFFITVQLHDAKGKMEQVFVQAEKIEAGQITGLIWNDINRVEGFAKGQRYTFPESELIDWTISNADGSEEGNVVGTFLDTWHGKVP